MNKNVQYEWDAEIQELCPVTGEVMQIHHDHHVYASRMLRTMEKWPVKVEGSAYHPVVVRAVFDSMGNLRHQSWAYLVKGGDGKWTLPEFFVDGCDVKCVKVPKYLKTDLEKAQK